jgi:hypothetical protein
VRCLVGLVMRFNAIQMRMPVEGVVHFGKSGRILGRLVPIACEVE